MHLKLRSCLGLFIICCVSSSLLHSSVEIKVRNYDGEFYDPVNVASDNSSSGIAASLDISLSSNYSQLELSNLPTATAANSDYLLASAIVVFIISVLVFL